VPAGQSARLFSLGNYPGHSLRGLYVFPLASITVEDAVHPEWASVTVCDAEALLAFERWNDSLYVFRAIQPDAASRR